MINLAMQGYDLGAVLREFQLGEKSIPMSRTLITAIVGKCLLVEYKPKEVHLG